MRLRQSEELRFALEVDYKPKSGEKPITLDDISENRKYRNDLEFVIRLPNGNEERKYIARRVIKKIPVVRFIVKKEEML
jgi:hypothetical protein